MCGIFVFTGARVMLSFLFSSYASQLQAMFLVTPLTIMASIFMNVFDYVVGYCDE